MIGHEFSGSAAARCGLHLKKTPYAAGYFQDHITWWFTRNETRYSRFRGRKHLDKNVHLKILIEIQTDTKVARPQRI